MTVQNRAYGTSYFCSFTHKHFDPGNLLNAYLWQVWFYPWKYNSEHNNTNLWFVKVTVGLPQDPRVKLNRFASKK